MKCRTPLTPYWLVLLALVALLGATIPAGAQSQTTSPQVQDKGQVQDDKGQVQGRDRDNDVTRHQLADFDRFLDAHPEIAEQLKRDPSLVNNQKFAADHPALQQFLADHPEVREQYKENPNAFMRQEDRFDRSEDSRGREIARPELANLDRFLDAHPEIAEQLKRDPSLVNNQKFAADHPPLQQFLADHPEVREQYKENPNAFMQQENRADNHEDSTMHRDHDLDRGQLSSFNRFLGDHGNISDELSRDPSLAKNPDYLRDHPELQDYLNAHPQVHEKLSENPQACLKLAQQFNPATTATPSTGDVSRPLKATQNK
jgi:hypothetical protein